MRRSLRVVLAGAATLAIIGSSRDASAQPTCTTPKTTCGGNAGYYASSEDVDRLTAVADPILRDVRTCLDGNGAKHVPAVLVIRWDSEGKPVEVKIDVPGYESLPCVSKGAAKLSSLQNPRETSIRCEFGCAKPPPPTPPPVVAPVVVPPPGPKQSTPTAAPPPPPPVVADKPAAPQYEKVWYGYQTLIVDAVSFGLVVGGLASSTPDITTVGYLTFLLGAPVVHFVHGNVGPGFGSLAIRVLLPPLAMGIGAITGLIVGSSSGSGDLEKFGNGANGAISGLVLGGLIGVAGCIAIDAAGFAYTKEKVEPNTTYAPQRRERWFTLAPTMDFRKDHASVGVVGRF